MRKKPVKPARRPRPSTPAGRQSFPTKTERMARNERMFRQWMDELWNRRNVEAARHMAHSDGTVRSVATLSDDAKGFEEFLGIYRLFTAAFPDLRVTVDEVICVNSKLASRFTFRGTHLGDFQGIPPTGNKIEFEIFGWSYMTRGKARESYNLPDQFTLLRQIGVMT